MPVSYQFDSPPIGLGDEPITRTHELSLVRHMVQAGRTVGMTPTSSAYRHAPVGLRRVILIKLGTDERRLKRDHNSSPMPGCQCRKDRARIRAEEDRPRWQSTPLATPWVTRIAGGRVGGPVQTCGSCGGGCLTRVADRREAVAPATAESDGPSGGCPA